MNVEIAQTLTVDLNDIANPVKQLLFTFFSEYILKSGQIYSLALYLYQIQLELDDNLIGVWSQAQTKTINVLADMSDSQEIKLRDDELQFSTLKIHFKNIKTIEQYRRKFFNFFELTGILGGLFEIFDIGFGFLIGILSHHLFK